MDTGVTTYRKSAGIHISLVDNTLSSLSNQTQVTHVPGTVWEACM